MSQPRNGSMYWLAGGAVPGSRAIPVYDIGVDPGTLEAPAITAAAEARGMPASYLIAHTHGADGSSAVALRACQANSGLPKAVEVGAADGEAHALLGAVLQCVSDQAVTPWLRPSWLSTLQAEVHANYGAIYAIDQYRLRPIANTIRFLCDSGLVEVTDSNLGARPARHLATGRGERILSGSAVALIRDSAGPPVGKIGWSLALTRLFEHWRITAEAESGRHDIKESLDHALTIIRDVCVRSGDDDTLIQLVRSMATAAVAKVSMLGSGLANLTTNPYGLTTTGATSDWSGAILGPAGSLLTSAIHLAPSSDGTRRAIWDGALMASTRVLGAARGSADAIRAGIIIGTVEMAAIYATVPERSPSERRAWAQAWLDRCLQIT